MAMADKNSPELLLLKIFGINRPSQPFLGCHMDFTTFSPWPFCVGLPDVATPFLQLFLSKYINGSVSCGPRSPRRVQMGVSILTGTTN